MFGVSYDMWKSICNMYFSLNAGSQKAYLQWFPFTKLSSADKENISGEEFYNSYIKTADRKSTRLNSSHASKSRMPSSA